MSLENVEVKLEWAPPRTISGVNQSMARISERRGPSFLQKIIETEDNLSQPFFHRACLR
jgi:hypothetical protein